MKNISDVKNISISDVYIRCECDISDVNISDVKNIAQSRSHTFSFDINIISGSLLALPATDLQPSYCFVPDTALLHARPLSHAPTPSTYPHTISIDSSPKSDPYRSPFPPALHPTDPKSGPRACVLTKANTRCATCGCWQHLAMPSRPSLNASRSMASLPETVVHDTGGRSGKGDKGRQRKRVKCHNKVVEATATH